MSKGNALIQFRIDDDKLALWKSAAGNMKLVDWVRSVCDGVADGKTPVLEAVPTKKQKNIVPEIVSDLTPDKPYSVMQRTTYARVPHKLGCPCLRCKNG